MKTVHTIVHSNRLTTPLILIKITSGEMKLLLSILAVSRSQAFVIKYAQVRVGNYCLNKDHTLGNQQPFGASNLKMSQKDDEKHNNFPSVLPTEMTFDETAAMIRLNAAMIDKLQKYFIREDRKSACVEILSAVQDVICVFKSECNKMARKQRLSKVLKNVPKTRYDYLRQLASSLDEKHVIIFELKAIVRILESAQCLEEDSAYGHSLPSAVTALVLEVLNEELKYKIPTKKIIDFKDVNMYFESTLRTLGKKIVEEL